MADVLKVPKSQAVALFVALGMKTAKKWDCKKLTKYINELEEVPDEPFEEDGLDELVDQLMEAEEAKVVEDEDLEESEEDVEMDEDIEPEDDDEMVQVEYTDEDFEEAKAANKAKKAAKSAKKNSKKSVEKPSEKPAKSAKKVAKPAKEKKEKKQASKTGEKTMDEFTLDLIRSKPMSFDVIVKNVMKQFPDKKEETVKKTTYRRLHGHLQSKFNVDILESDRGTYSVQE